MARFLLASARVFARSALVRLAAKQQTAALMATVVDYSVMSGCASGAGMNAALATACGALVGTFVGFALGRRWVFRAVDGAALPQWWRYLVVSLMSLLANAGGEALLVRTGLHYLAARPIISTTVGLGWNLPMQQLFVFRPRGVKKPNTRSAAVTFSDASDQRNPLRLHGTPDAAEPRLRGDERCEKA